MKKILFVVFTIFVVILLFLALCLCDPYSLLEFEKTDPDAFMDVYRFGVLSSYLFSILIELVCDTFLLIFRKVRKLLEKQGKE